MLSRVTSGNWTLMFSLSLQTHLACKFEDLHVLRMGPARKADRDLQKKTRNRPNVEISTCWIFLSALLSLIFGWDLQGKVDVNFVAPPSEPPVEEDEFADLEAELDSLGS